MSDGFVERLNGSSHAVFVVAEYLHGKGYTVTVPRIRVAPHAALHADYIDDGDLYISADEGLEIVEVKGLLTTQFSCPEDWPHEHFFVNRIGPVDRHDLVPDYYIVSSDFRHVARVPGNTRPCWYKVTTRNSRTGNVECFYACPLGLVRFAALS